MDKVTREGAKMIEEAKRAAQWLRRHRLEELGFAGTSSMISDIELTNIECLTRTIADLTEQVRVRDKALRTFIEKSIDDNACSACPFHNAAECPNECPDDEELIASAIAAALKTAKEPVS